MTRNDNDLQDEIERGVTEDHSADAAAYRQVFSALRQEVPFVLSSSFADHVIERVVRESQEREAARDRLWFILGCILFLVGLVVSLLLVDFKPGVGVFTFLKGYPGLVLFAAVFIGLLHFLDRKFIRSATPR